MALKSTTLHVVREAINRWDPETLLETGAPPDEYEHEIRDVAGALAHCRSEEEIAQQIRDVFSVSFNRSFPIEHCRLVAQQIWSRLRERRS